MHRTCNNKAPEGQASCLQLPHLFRLSSKIYTALLLVNVALLSSCLAPRYDLPNAGLANVTATFLNLLGLEAPDFYEPTLITTD